MIQANESRGADRRRTKRYPVAWAAFIVQGLRHWSCLITDISLTGARLRSVAPIELNSPSRLRCERFGELRGIVKWHRGEIAGFRFEDPPEVVRRKLEHITWADARSKDAGEKSTGKDDSRFGRKPTAR